MNCAAPDCRASIAWVGHPEDKALDNIALASGWRYIAGGGWRCPKHQRAARVVGATK